MIFAVNNKIYVQSLHIVQNVQAGKYDGVLSSGKASASMKNNILRLQACPNPFASKLQWSFYLDKTSSLGLKVYDINMQLIYKPPQERMDCGKHFWTCNGKSNHGNALSLGFYFCKITDKERKGTILKLVKQ